MELYEQNALDDLKTRLAAYNFALDQYVVADGKLFDIIDEEGKREPCPYP